MTLIKIPGWRHVITFLNTVETKTVYCPDFLHMCSPRVSLDLDLHILANNI